MRRIISILLMVVVCCSAADARTCAVNCQQFIQAPVAVVQNVPVATFYPIQYQFSPTPNVTINIAQDAIDKAVQRSLMPAAGGGPSPPTAPPSQPPAPNTASVFATRCLKCHSSGDQAAGKPNLAGVLDCQTKLLMVHDIVSQKMPKDGQLNADDVGKLIEEISK